MKPGNAIWGNWRRDSASCILAIGTEVIVELAYFKFGPNYKAHIDDKHFRIRSLVG